MDHLVMKKLSSEEKQRRHSSSKRTRMMKMNEFGKKLRTVFEY
jgi:hypothetical protein